MKGKNLFPALSFGKFLKFFLMLKNTFFVFEICSFLFQDSLSRLINNIIPFSQGIDCFGFSRIIFSFFFVFLLGFFEESLRGPKGRH